jgi:hydroxymethylglutaryl-CoA lyase
MRAWSRACFTPLPQVKREIERPPGVRYAALVPNAKGMERALAAGVDEIAVFTGASETFVQHNINTSIDGSIEYIKVVVAMACERSMRVRGYISTAFGRPYGGAVAPKPRAM